MKKKLFLYFLYFSISYSSHGQEIYLDDAGEYPLKSKIQYLLTPNKISPQQANDSFAQKKGQIITEDFFNKAPLDNICWLNFKVKNNEKAKKLYFRVGRADIHHFEAFKVTPKKIDTLILSGDSKPFIQRPIQVADLSFPFELKPYESASIVIMMEKRGEELNMNFFLQGEQKFYGNVQKDYNFIFFYLGILFIIFYSIFFFG